MLIYFISASVHIENGRAFVFHINTSFDPIDIRN